MLPKIDNLKEELVSDYEALKLKVESACEVQDLMGIYLNLLSYQFFKGFCRIFS